MNVNDVQKTILPGNGWSYDAYRFCSINMILFHRIQSRHWWWFLWYRISRKRTSIINVVTFSAKIEKPRAVKWTPVPIKIYRFLEKLWRGGHFWSNRFHYKFGADPKEILVMSFWEILGRNLKLTTLLRHICYSHGPSTPGSLLKLTGGRCT